MAALPAVPMLQKLIQDAPDTAARLRALWALHVTFGIDARTGIENLKSRDEWGARLDNPTGFREPGKSRAPHPESNDQGLKADPDLDQMAETDPSPLVRLFIASAAQRTRSPEFRSGLVKRLLAHGEDSADHNLPLMYWFAMEPLAADHSEESLTVALDTKIPRILNFVTRRIASLGTIEARDLLASTLGKLDDSARQLDMLTGLAAALKGQIAVPMPKDWAAVETKLAESANANVRILSQSLSLTFGSRTALAALRKTVSDPGSSTATRRAALDSLVGVKDAELPATLQLLLKDDTLRGAALRALAVSMTRKHPRPFWRFTRRWMRHKSGMR